ncbi:hypothetical protein BMS3Abin12_00899 [bacterium BMS3Abin12]|nr:hypothetical protein BMS3Abin12_00899 [bacterium BMS3Abin12]
MTAGAAASRDDAPFTTPAPETMTLLSALHGFGPQARIALRRVAARLLPLPPEGDAADGLWLRREVSLTDWRTPPKTRAATGRAPASWGPPQLVLCLLDAPTPEHRPRLIGTLSRCEAETLALVLAPPGQDAAALYADLLPHTRARLGVFETRNPEPRAPEALAHALLASLYRENLICLDFDDLRAVLPGAGRALYCTGGLERKMLRDWGRDVRTNGSPIGLFCGVLAAPDCIAEAFAGFSETVAREIKRWEARGTEVTTLVACVADSRTAPMASAGGFLWVARSPSSTASQGGPLTTDQECITDVGVGAFLQARDERGEPMESTT